MISGVPGGAPLYSLSVAWVSICEVLAAKRVLRRSLALFCLLPSYFQASENLVNKGVQRSLCYFTLPFSCLNGVNTRHFVLYIMDPIQIISNINLKIYVLNREF